MAHIPRTQGSARVFQFLTAVKDKADSASVADADCEVVAASSQYPALPLAHGDVQKAHSVGDLIEYTLEIAGVLRDRLLSDSRCRYLTLPRAFITYHGVKLGFSLTEIGHWLCRHPSTLLQGARRSQTLYGDLFTPAVTQMIVKKKTAKLQQLFARHARGRR